MNAQRPKLYKKILTSAWLKFRQKNLEIVDVENHFCGSASV
jgi:hypothetical protein